MAQIHTETFSCLSVLLIEHNNEDLFVNWALKILQWVYHEWKYVLS